MTKNKTLREKKNCMFQYALNPSKVFLKEPIIENTELITRKEADKLWDKYLMDFMKQLENGREPEMVIWINCKNCTDYREDIKHIHADNTMVESGHLYKVEKERLI